MIHHPKVVMVTKQSSPQDVEEKSWVFDILQLLKNWISKMWGVLVVNIILSIMGYSVILNIVPKFKDMFVKAHLSGVDLNKKNKPEL
jgi:hypothetical protein